MEILLKILFSLIVGAISLVIIVLVSAGLSFLAKISVWYCVIAVVVLISLIVFKEIKDL